MCFWRFPLKVDVDPQCGHGIFLPSCTDLMCVWRLPLCVAVYSQCLHCSFLDADWTVFSREYNTWTKSNMENRNQVRSFGLVSSKLGGRGIEKVLGDSTIILLFYFFPIHDPNVKHPWCRLWVGVSIEIAKILACQTKLSPRSGDTHGYQPALITIT